MANAASTIEIELEIRDAINRLGKLEGELKKSSSAMDRVANSTRKMESAFKSAKNAASALVAAISVQQIAQAADTFTNFANQIRIATNSAAEAAAVQKELYRVAQTTGTAIKDTTELYSLLRIAADQLGSSQAETIRITEIVTKSLAAAGKSSTEASGALLQLAQALNSPIVQAEEFNSLIDGMPNLLKQVEKQLGLTAGSLIKFVKEGNLSNQEFKDAILGSAEAINEQFGAAQDTIATSLTRISNSFTLLIGKVEESTGIFSGTAKVMTDLAGEFDKSDGIVRDFAEGIKILGIAFDKLKQLAINLTKPLRDAFSSFTGGESNPIVTTLNYIQAGFGFLSVAAQYETQNAALNIERLTLHVRDFFIGMIANMFSFFEKVDNFFINQINKVIGYYNSAANAIGMDGDVAPIATSTEAQESALKFERDSAFELAENYRKSADLWTQYKAALEGVAGEFRGLQNQIDSGTLIKTEEQLGNVNLEAANAASSVEKLKEKIEEVKEIEYTDFTGKISQEQQDRFTEALEEEFRIRREMGQLTEEQQGRFTQGLEEEFRRVTEINALTEDKNRLYEESLFPKARELTYLEEVTAELKTQLLLQGQLNEEAERTAEAIVSGVSGAGPNASRATNIAQSKTVEEAAAKLILSNEKVAKAIDSSFEILFDTIDPLIDILGDLLSAINRLIGALLENATNAAEGLLDTVGLGPNGYIFGGGLARDLEDAFGFGPGSSKATGPTATQAAIASADKVFAALETEQSSLEKLQPKIDELAALLEDIPLASIIERFAEQTQKAVAELETAKDWYEETLASGDGFRGAATPTFTNYLKGEIEKLDATIAEVNEKTSIVISGLISEFLSEPLATLDDLERSATDSIAAIEFQKLSAEEQIQFRYDEAIATIEQQRALADLINDEELRSQLLDSVNRATQAQNDLLEKQQEELQKLNEEREREARLLAIQNIETGLQGLLRDFERTIEDIDDLVQGLFDQVNDLLFSEFNLASPQETFAMASDEYQDLLAKAFEPEATEEDIKNLQGFVNEYLSASRDVYKSSSAFQEIFDNVLQDLTKLGISYGFNAPLNAVSGLQKDLETILVDLPEDLQQATSDLIAGLNLAATAFAQQQIEFLTTVNVLPIQLEEGNFDFDLPVVNLGTITTNFDTDGFKTAIRGLNDSIVSAVNAFTATIQGAETAVETGGTASAVDPATEAALSGGSTESGEVYIPPTYGPVEELYRQGTALTDNYTPYLGPLNDTDYSSVYTGTNAGLYTYADLAKTLQGSLDNLMGADYTKNTYQYAVGAEEMLGNTLYKSVAFFADLAAANDHIGAIENQIAIQEAIGNPVTVYTKYGFRHGGIVDAMDTIPAMLSPGEYILSPETVRRYGVSNLNRLNSGDSAALNATSDPEVKRLLAELIVAVRENDTEVNVYTDMQGQTKAGIEEFRSELRERTRRQGDKFLPARYI